MSIHSLELDADAAAPAQGHLLDWNRLSADRPAVLARQSRNVHKGSFGTLAIVGGADGMVGAPLLAGRAAVHAGAGKVWIGLVAVSPPAVDWKQPELMLRAVDDVLGGGASAIVCGPGMGTSAAAHALVARAIRKARSACARCRRAQRDRRGSGACCGRRHSRSRHDCDAASGGGRAAAGQDTAAVQADRLAAARTLSARLNAPVVVKGAGSVLAHVDGTWDINGSGNAGLASAGTGDALAGFAGAFLAQGIDAKSALRFAVCLHGAAADACVRNGRGPFGLTAGELPRRRARVPQFALTLGKLYGTSTVAPVVARDCSARCASAASLSA